jgi:hypothetical protein
MGIAEAERPYERRQRKLDCWIWLIHQEPHDILPPPALALRSSCSCGMMPGSQKKRQGGRKREKRRVCAVFEVATQRLQDITNAFAKRASHPLDVNVWVNIFFSFVKVQ